ncbi:hypothetical protein [Acidisphaera sp. L21]|uniref:hypothetical protein n=1 Tax=Acidisphaera sp. L21 TaxID=1641851 RepID=UPI001C205F0D|nr:hypothetical protein [Acidisphaera sp. L21]
MSALATQPPLPERCVLQSHVFTTFGEIRFRRSDTDGKPMMAVTLGEREAQLPLSSLRREFGIEEDSPDGRMLDLIGSALEYVPSLAPGDRLPTEVLTGEASWRPSPQHIRLATTRIRLNLVAWLSPNSRWANAERDEITLLRLADDQGLKDEVVEVAMPAAQKLDLHDATNVLRLLEEMSHELAYIEALRQRLLARVEGLCRRMAQVLLARRRMTTASDTLGQVHRLAMLAYKQLRDRFDDVDAQTGEFSSMMRNVDNQRAFIRSNRDWLYRNQRSWDPLLGQWDGVDEMVDDITALLAKTYQFLAPRFMPTKQWQTPKQQHRSAGSGTTGLRPQMAW